MIDGGTIFADRYRVEAYINKGGMQEVYKATDLRLEQHVALKTPLADQKHRRFEVSAQISAKVNHHNIAKTYDCFVEDDIPYLIEEFVDGETLDEALLQRSDAIDPHLGAHLFQNLAKGVAASHHANVVHRDLKPSNIIIGGEFNLNEVKITDFGIATLAEDFFDDEIGEDGDITRSTSGTVKGALPYMAPEMMFRKPGEHPGAPLDIWSLGAMMFKVLTGKYPFGTGFEVPVNVKAGNRTPWPDFMTSSEQFAPLSKSLKKLVKKCLDTDPTKRPTADELVELCGDLCYFKAPRITGVIARMRNTAWGFIDVPGKADVFFNRDSVYGDTRAKPNTAVSFSSSPGSPQDRAHPIIILK